MHLTLAFARAMTHISMLRILVRFISVSAVAACFAVAAQPTTSAAGGSDWQLSTTDVMPTAASPSQMQGAPVNLNARLGGPEAKAAVLKPPVGPAPAAEGANAADLHRSPAAQNTEFQRFVLEGTGKQLPLFGFELFESPTFPSLTNVPVPTDYVVGPGDEIVLRVWGTVNVDTRTVVDRNGQISLPRVGTFRIAGTPASQLDSALRAQVAKVYKNFELNATLGQLRAIQIFVVGHAKRPGAYTVSSLSTLLSALFEVGGPAGTGTLRGIQLRRDGRVITSLDLYKFLVDGDKSADARLLPGDVIVIPSAGPRVALLGSIDKPAIYELGSSQEPLSRLLSYNGSLRALTSQHKVLLERINPAERAAPRTVQERALDSAGLAADVRDGDVVTLFTIGPQFSNAVTLRGNVAAPLRHAFKPGMRVSDLIPERAALIQRDYYTRKNKLVQYESPANVSVEQVAGDVKNLLSEINWDYAVVERLDPLTVRTQLLPFNLGRAVLEQAPEDNLVLQTGDVVTVFGVKDIPVPRGKTTRLVRVAGEVNVAGVYQIDPGETLRSVLRRAGGTTPQAYLYGTEFSRESTRQRQREALQEVLRRLESTTANAVAQKAANTSGSDAATAQRLLAAQEQARASQLARLRTQEPTGRISLELTPEINSIDALPDLPLEDGDRVLVPAANGFVYAVGAVANSNALLWRKGRTVKQYLLAAGLEPSADEDNIFILRADGSILHRRDAGWLFSGFESTDLAQGDTLIVPEKVDLETKWSGFVRGLKDWTQILANLGLSAAAIKTLGQ
jgi:protein involved in polysaccharide export with SLBB domain